jgi:hypothetical protein
LELGFVGDRAFQPAGGEQRSELGGAEMFAVADIHGGLKGVARGGCLGRLEEPGHLRGSLRGGNA